MRPWLRRSAGVADRQQPTISVLAGVNGAGKSSILGSLIEESSATYVNPDLRTNELRKADPDLSLEQANSKAWMEGLRLLEQAIHNRQSYIFETTLGGHTITECLREAMTVMPVRIFYVGLTDPELHIKRVRARVRAGGHDIPDNKILERYSSSRANLIILIPGLSELRVYDNSAEGDPNLGGRPNPRLLLEMHAGKIVEAVSWNSAPDWVRPILAGARIAGGSYS